MTDLPIQGFYGEYRFLSNFWYSNQTIDGVMFPTNEHWFVWNKTLDESERAEILVQPSPGDVKRFGRTITLRTDWDDIKDAVMYTGLTVKFQNAVLREQLRGTHTRYLEETNTWNDTYWGVCRGRGRNRLGLLLMQVRADLSMESTV